MVSLRTRGNVIRITAEECHHQQRNALALDDPELSYHIRHCPCSCDHMGYGNYLDYQIPPPPYRQQPDEPLPSSFDNPLLHQHHPCHYYCEFEVASTSCSCSSSSTSSSSSFRSYGSWCICFFVCILVGTVAAVLSVHFTVTVSSQLHRRSHAERLQAVARLLKSTPLIDGHNDLPWNLRKFVHNQLGKVNLSRLEGEEPWKSSRWSHTDIPKLRMGLLGAQFWSAYVPCKSQYMDAVQLTLEQIDVVQRFVELNAQHLTMVRTAAELIAVHREGRIASLIGVEGGHALGNSLAVLRTFYNLGARYLTITHNCDTAWASSANSSSVLVADGLTEFGRRVIQEMNRLGMMIDLSHASMATARAAINASRAPVIFSHSGAYSLCNSTRNVPDDVLKMMARNGGVVMVNFYAHLVTCSANATVHDVIKHINHIRNVAGVEHVGIGAGYDGINVTPSGLENVSKYPHLFAELLADPVWTEDDVIRLAGLNLLRVFKEVEEVRDKWHLAEIQPGEELSPTFGPLQCTSMYS